MVKKKKVGAAGKYGARYGLKLRKRVASVLGASSKKHKCPYCSRSRVKRVSAGIYNCEKCGAKFTGRAYAP